MYRDRAGDRGVKPLLASERGLSPTITLMLYGRIRLAHLVLGTEQTSYADVLYLLHTRVDAESAEERKLVDGLIQTAPCFARV